MLRLPLREVSHLSSRLSWSELGLEGTRSSGTHRIQIVISKLTNKELTDTAVHVRETDREALRRGNTADEEARVDDMRVKVLEGAETDHRAASIQVRIAAIATVVALHRVVAQVENPEADEESRHAKLMTQQVKTYLG